MAPATILNVDDDEAGRYAVTQMLRSANFEVYEAASGLEALDQAAEHMPDIMLLDVRMPDIDGFEVCRRIKANPKTAAITVIHLSASLIAPEDKALGLESGADGYLTEPISRGELIATVRAYLRLRSAEAVQRFLAQVSSVLSKTLEADEALRQMASLAVPFLADLCLVDRVDEQGAIEAVALVRAGEPPLDAQRLSHSFPPSPSHGIAWVAETGKPELHSYVTDTAHFVRAIGLDQPSVLRELSATSYMCLPLVARDRTLGVMTLVSASSQRHYTYRDLAVAEDLASRSALLVDNARLYEAAQQAIDTRENLLAVVSHDLKTPLGIISMNSALMLMQLQFDDRGRRLRRQAESIQRAVDKMDHLIHDLLNLASLDKGTLSMLREPQQASDLVEEIIDMFEPLALEKGLLLHAEVQDDLPAVSCDKERIFQVLSNLLGNALKFTPSGGSVMLGVKVGDDALCFSVTDTGSGIASAQLPHIFDRFWQGRDAARTGTGLGLSIVRGIVEAHGGRVGVESEPGKGSTFTFSLPLASAER